MVNLAIHIGYFTNKFIKLYTKENFSSFLRQKAEFRP